MSYPDDELDSRAPGRRDAAADEAARIEDQAVPHVVHLGSNSALANQLNAGFNALTPATVANLTSIARSHGQLLRVTPAVRSEIVHVVDSVPSGSLTAASLMPDKTEIIPVPPGSENVIYADGEWHFLLPIPPEPTEDQALAAKLANLSRLTELINVAGSALAVVGNATIGAAKACHLLAEELEKFESEADHG